MIFAVYLLMAYLVGSIPSGVLLARAMRAADPRHGDDKKIRAITFVLDFLKGFLPVIFAYLYWPDDSFPAAIGAFFAVLGHCYSIFLFFQGGKGLAAGAGALFPLAPFAMLVALAAWGFSYYVFRIKPQAALIAILSFFGALFIFGTAPHLLAVAGACALMMVRRHRADLDGLLAGVVSR
ncbi:MAG: hypothetical protein EOP11_06665 [Proteobacteria bacterium]|nr:MAG: hypothetical protein EOP11_06665 [Pseudomonadota bacterium]